MNQVKATIKKHYLFIGLFLILVFSNFGFAQAASQGGIIELTNINRQKNGLNSLIANEKLNNAAYAKAKDMFSKQYFAHISPDGVTPWYFILNSGYEYISAGENLAIGYTSDAEVVNDWMNSPSHSANILNAKFSEIGVAVVEGTYENESTYIIVQMFGDPKILAPIEAKTEDKSILSVSADEEAGQPAEAEKIRSETVEVAPTSTANSELIGETKTDKTEDTTNVSEQEPNAIGRADDLIINYLVLIFSLSAIGLVLVVYLVLRYQKLNRIA